MLDDLLEDWQSGYQPAFEGIRLLGNRWSPASYAVKDFRARNHVLYKRLQVRVSLPLRRARL